MLQTMTRKQSTSLPDEDEQYCSPNVAVNIKSDSIVRQMKKVHFLSYTTKNNKHILLQLCLAFSSVYISLSKNRVYPAYAEF